MKKYEKIPWKMTSIHGRARATEKLLKITEQSIGMLPTAAVATVDEKLLSDRSMLLGWNVEKWQILCENVKIILGKTTTNVYWRMEKVVDMENFTFGEEIYVSCDKMAWIYITNLLTRQ